MVVETQYFVGYIDSAISWGGGCPAVMNRLVSRGDHAREFGPDWARTTIK